VLPLRRTPALRFRHDRSIEDGSKTLELLSSLRRSEASATEGEDGD
jgi:ribosome-binding factor A